MNLDWAIVEVMGHRVFAGRVEEVQVSGVGMLRVDVPAVWDAPAFTKILAPQAIYGITPTTEVGARAAAARLRARPFTEYELPEVAVWYGQALSPGDDDEPERDDVEPDDDEEVPF